MTRLFLTFLWILSAVIPCHADGIRRVWTIPAPNVCALALSPGGETVAVVTDTAPGAGRQKIALWRWKSRPDRPVWVRPEPGTSFVVVGPDGESVLTAAHFVPSRPSVTVRQGTDGAEITQEKLDGAVWDMTVSPDGRYASFVTGGRSASILTLDGAFGIRRIPMNGIGNSIRFAPDGSTFCVGTWDTGGVQAFTSSGSALWQWTEGGVWDVQAAGDWLLGLTGAGARRLGPTVVEWPLRGDGKPRWRFALPPDASDAHARLSGDGTLVAVSYSRWPLRAAAPASRLLLLDTTDGRKIWERGSFLFAPTLLAMDTAGQRITVSDGQKTLYTLDVTGRITATYNVGASIRQAQATPDGKFLLGVLGTDTVSLFQLE